MNFITKFQTKLVVIIKIQISDVSTHTQDYLLS